MIPNLCNYKDPYETIAIVVQTKLIIYAAYVYFLRIYANNIPSALPQNTKPTQ
jgi:hypothetical protein